MFSTSSRILRELSLALVADEGPADAVDGTHLEGMLVYTECKRPIGITRTEYNERRT